MVLLPALVSHPPTLRVHRASSPLYRRRVPTFQHRIISCQQQQSPSNSQGTNDGMVFDGMYGPWSIDEYDVREVTAYRACVNIAAGAFVIGTVAALAQGGIESSSVLQQWGTLLSIVGAGSLGASLVLIHIYVTPLKRFVQALWAVGTLGGLSIVATQKVSLPVYVANHPESMWLVGPLFAALTGLAFKEGMCYGKPESALLFFVVPAMCLAHLSGRCPEGVETGLVAVSAGLLTVFAGRKWAQPIKDDIGDKSVFMFQALSPEEQQERLGR